MPRGRLHKIVLCQRFLALQRHLDCGRHVRALESATMPDKDVRVYAARLEGHFTSVREFEEDTTSTDTPARQSQLQMGWALQFAQTSRTRISDKQKTVLDKQIPDQRNDRPEGESSAAMSSMITAIDKTSKRRFSITEFLTAKQIMIIFSRLAAKRSLSFHSHAPVISDEDEKEEDGEEFIIDTAFGELRDHVMVSVQNKHPICYESYNLCPLMSKSKLLLFAITMLKNICEHFVIDTEDIITKRKATYI